MTRGDIDLPEDRLHFRTAAWGGTMASRGRLLLLQTRYPTPQLPDTQVETP